METQLDPQVTQCILTGAQCCHKEGALCDKDRGVPIKTGEDSLVRTREEPSGTLHLERSPSAANRDSSTSQHMVDISLHRHHTSIAEKDPGGGGS